MFLLILENDLEKHLTEILHKFFFGNDPKFKPVLYPRKFRKMKKYIIDLDATELENLVTNVIQKVLKGKKINSGFFEVQDEFLTIQQAAEFTSYDVNTLYRFTSKKEIPHIKKGNKLLFSRNDLTQWLLDARV